MKGGYMEIIETQEDFIITDGFMFLRMQMVWITKDGMDLFDIRFIIDNEQMEVLGHMN